MVRGLKGAFRDKAEQLETLTDGKKSILIYLYRGRFAAKKSKFIKIPPFCVGRLLPKRYISQFNSFSFHSFPAFLPTFYFHLFGCVLKTTFSFLAIEEIEEIRSYLILTYRGKKRVMDVI